MNAVVVVMLLSAGAAESSGFSVDGAGTAYLQPASSSSGSASLGTGTHLRLGVGYQSGAFFAEGRASLLLSYAGLGLTFQDLGSQVAVGVRWRGFVEELRVTLWPYNSVTALPVFDWANRIGVRPLDFAPAASLQLSTRVGTLWVTSRFRALQNSLKNISEIRPDVFFGLSTVLPRGFQLDARAASFQYGQVPSLGQSGVEALSDGFMVSGRLSWTWNEPVGPAMDFDLYNTDPWRFERFFVTEARVTRAALYFSLEGGGGSQVLMDPDKYATMKRQPLGWADAQLRVRVSQTRLFLTGRLHSTSLEVEPLPALPPYSAFASGSTLAPRLELLAGFDTTWRAARLTPGILVRLTRPSSVQAPRFDFQGANPPSGLAGPRTVIVYDGPMFSITPYGAQVRPLLNVKFSLKWEPVAFLMVAGELTLEKDWNDLYFDTTDGLNQPAATKFAVRGQLLLQARF